MPPSTLFSGSFAEIYDSHMVPLIFERPAQRMAARVDALSPRFVLETAAGTGVLTRHVADRLDRQARLRVTDVNPGMLDVARRRLPDDPRIEWGNDDAMAIDLPDDSADVVCCQFGVMFLDDRLAGYREARRVLRPGGAFLFSIWGKIADNDIARITEDSVAAAFPDDAPRFLSQAPYSYHDPVRVEDELRQAGFRGIAFETVSERVEAPDPGFVANAMCHGTPLRAAIRERDDARLQPIMAQIDAEVGRHCGTAPVRHRITFHMVSAVA